MHLLAAGRGQINFLQWSGSASINLHATASPMLKGPDSLCLVYFVLVFLLLLSFYFKFLSEGKNIKLGENGDRKIWEKFREGHNKKYIHIKSEQ